MTNWDRIRDGIEDLEFSLSQTVAGNRDVGTAGQLSGAGDPPGRRAGAPRARDVDPQGGRGVRKHRLRGGDGGRTAAAGRAPGPRGDEPVSGNRTVLNIRYTPVGPGASKKAGRLTNY